MNLKKWMLVFMLGLLTGVSGHALDSFENILPVAPQQQLQEDSSSLPFHYEQIHLLSLQQAVEQGHSASGNPFPVEEFALIAGLDIGPLRLWILQDIRFLLEIQLFPFHSFW